jgi:hypothetical protein
MITQPGTSSVGEKRVIAEGAGNIEEVFRLYNTAVDPYNTFKITETTKSQILHELRKKLIPVLTYLIK